MAAFSLTDDTVMHDAGDESLPAKELNLYRRIFPGRKYFFAPPGKDEAEYFIINPVPNKHANTWKPVFYNGDNPKYATTSRAVARVRRGGLWSSFRIDMGDGVHEVLQNERRVRMRKHYEFKQKFRRFFRMKPTPPKKELEDEQEVQGSVMKLRMRRLALFHRSLSFELDGHTYRWSGTRRYLKKGPGLWKRSKWISHDFKLVNESKQVVATFEKKRWASYQRAEKSKGSFNKTRSLIGILRFFPHQFNQTVADEDRASNTDKAVLKQSLDDPLDKGALLEQNIALTCWIAVEAEHRQRYKSLDILQEIGEVIGG